MAELAELFHANAAGEEVVIEYTTVALLGSLRDG